MKRCRKFFAGMAICALLLGLALPASGAGETGAVHILNTGWEDAIVLESGGHYALIDAGEPGRGPYIVNYLQRLAGSQSVHLDFVLGTHSHVDHMGGFPYILAHPDITVGTAYAKRETKDVDDPVDRGHYQKFVAGCEDKKIPLVLDDLDNLALTLGSMKITLLNGAPLASGRTSNQESLCQLVEIGGCKALLAGDMVSAEKELGVSSKTGAVDLLKIGHHGMGDSTGKAFAKALKPKAAVYTNGSSWETDSQDATLGATKSRKSYFYLKDVGTAQYATTDNGGVMAVFGPEGMELRAIKEFTKNDATQVICETRAEITLRTLPEPQLRFFERVARFFIEMYLRAAHWFSRLCKA